MAWKRMGQSTCVLIHLGPQLLARQVAYHISTHMHVLRALTSRPHLNLHPALAGSDDMSCLWLWRLRWCRYTSSAIAPPRPTDSADHARSRARQSRSLPTLTLTLTQPQPEPECHKKAPLVLFSY